MSTQQNLRVPLFVVDVRKSRTNITQKPHEKIIPRFYSARRDLNASYHSDVSARAYVLVFLLPVTEIIVREEGGNALPTGRPILYLPASIAVK